MQSGKIFIIVLVFSLLSVTGGYVWYVFSPSFFSPSFFPRRANTNEDIQLWQERSNMPTARTLLSSAVLNGKIYAIGGIDGYAKTVSTVEVYDPESDKWEQATDMPEGLHGTTTVVYGDKLYVLGGYDGLGMVPQREVYVYDPALNLWTRGVSMPQARAGHGSVVAGDYVYVLGGVTGKGLSSDFLRFNFNENKWEKLPSMLSAKDQFAVAVVDNKIIVAGGRERSLRKNLSSLEIFHIFNQSELTENIDPLFPDRKPVAGQWEHGQSMADARGSVAGVKLADSLVVIGGQELSGTFNTVSAYDLPAKQWYPFPALQYARFGATGAVVDNVLYVIGGGRRPFFSVSNINEALTVKPL